MSKNFFPSLYGQNFGIIILHPYLLISFSIKVLFNPFFQSLQFKYSLIKYLKLNETIIKNNKKNNTKLYFFFLIRYNIMLKGINIIIDVIMIKEHPIKLYSP